jgi:ferric-dicitrate binding protein FerR (iron transport regulator)
LEDNEKLTELFRRYLNDQHTPEELELLLRHFGSKEELVLRRLIHDTLSDPIDAGSQEYAPQLDKVYRELSSRIGNKPAAGVIRRRLIRSLAAAVVVFVLGMASLRAWHAWQASQHVPLPYEQVVTVRGQRKQVRLSDGTTVWLGPGSELKYPARFTGGQRDVVLKGEAYFEVNHDPSHQFIVHTDSLYTRVLGTSFNIRAYGDGSDPEIILLTGKVSVGINDNSSGQLTLLPGQHAVYDEKESSLKKEDYPDAGQVLARRNGELIYKGTPLEKVIADIRLFYNIDIILPPGLRKCLYYGNFNSSDDPRLIPQQIAFAFNASVKEDGERVWKISGGECK